MKRTMNWLHDKTTEMLDRVQEAKDAKAFPFFRPMGNVGSRVKVDGASYINFTSNDYLGLSTDRRLIHAATKATRRFGTGLGSARPQATSVPHLELERRLARWAGFGSCAVFTTGYMGLLGALTAFLDDDTTVIIDRLSHASIIDGILLARGQHPDLEMRFFKHNNMKSLEKCLTTSKHEKKLVVVEGLYSVDGDLGRLDEIVAVAKKHDAAIAVDDAHGLGSLGPTGRGVCEHFGVLSDVDILIGTFSKSFGGIGGFVLADEALVDYMKLSARSFLFSASLPVSLVESAMTALDIIEKDDTLRRRLQDNKTFFREGLLDLGFDLGDSETHITPIMLRDEMLALKAGAYLFHGGGVMMMPFVSPGVASGTERLRCNVTAAHTRAQMGYALEVIAQIGEMLEILPAGASTGRPAWQRALWFAQHGIEGTRNAGLGHLAKLYEVHGKEPVDKLAGDLWRAVRRTAPKDGWSEPAQSDREILHAATRAQA